MSGRDKVDLELDAIIGRISKVQGTLGSKPDEKMQHIMGADGKVDRWEELKRSITDRLVEIKTWSEEIAEFKAGNARDTSQTDRIRKEQSYRTAMQAAERDFKEIDDLQKGEAKKKRSKYSKADLEIRQSEAGLIKRKLDEQKEFSRRGFVGAREGYGSNGSRPVDKSASDLFSGNGRGDASKEAEPRAPQETVTAEQQQQMQQIEQRDQDIDTALTGIGKGVDMLHELAQIQNQKVKESSLLLDDLGDRVEGVQDQVLTINDQLKATLEMARSGDKLCMDILCILIMLGMIFVLYKVSNAASD